MDQERQLHLTLQQTIDSLKNKFKESCSVVSNPNHSDPNLSDLVKGVLLNNIIDRINENKDNNDFRQTLLDRYTALALILASKGTITSIKGPKSWESELHDTTNKLIISFFDSNKVEKLNFPNFDKVKEYLKSDKDFIIEIGIESGHSNLTIFVQNGKFIPSDAEDGQPLYEPDLDNEELARRITEDFGTDDIAINYICRLLTALESKKSESSYDIGNENDE